MPKDNLLPPALILEEPKAEEWTLGSFDALERFGSVDINPSGNWTPYMVQDEDQAIKFEFDTQGCAVFHTLRPLAMLAKFHGFTEFPPNMSERYTGAHVGVTYNGSNPHSVVELVRSFCGAIPQDSMPWTPDIKTFEAYYNKEQAGYNLPLGKKLLDRYEIGHEWVFPFRSGLSPKEKTARLKSALKRGTVAVSAKAWRSKGDMYTKRRGENDTHWVTVLRFDGNNLVVHDTYAPYIKTLTEDYDHEAAKVYFLKRKVETKKSFWSEIWDSFALLWKPKVPEVTPVPSVEAPKPPVEAPKPPVVKTARERLYDTAYGCLGRRMGLDTSIPKDVNCANALSHVLILAGVKGLPKKGIPGTANLYEWLKKSPEFERVDTPLEGDVVIYPTGYGKARIPNGHAFVKGKFQMMSNNSATGLWDSHWASLKEAQDFYTKKGGIPQYCFRLKG